MYKKIIVPMYIDQLCTYYTHCLLVVARVWVRVARFFLTKYAKQRRIYQITTTLPNGD
jgi:hypothetical protein